MNLIPIIFDNDLSNMFDKNNNLIINDDISDEFTINEYIRGVIELNEDEFYTLFSALSTKHTINNIIVDVCIDYKLYESIPDYIKRSKIIFKHLRCNPYDLINGDETTIVVPNGVTHLVNFDDDSSDKIEQIILSSSVMYIDESTFSDYENLIFVDLQNCNNLLEIGKYAFQSTGIKKISIPQSVTYIGEAAFCNCYSLTSIDLSECKITVLENNTFYNCCNLSNVVLPSCLQSIGESVFRRCFQLNNINLDSCVYLSTIDESAFLDTNLQKINILNVTHIYDFAFRKSGCEALSILRCEYIGIEAFQCTNLKEIVLPSSTTEIDYGAFSECCNLTSIDLHNCKINVLEKHTFAYDYSLINVKLPTTLTRINERAFYYCVKLNVINLDDCINLHYIGYNAFKNTKIELDLNKYSIFRSPFQKQRNIQLDTDTVYDDTYVIDYSIKNITSSSELYEIGDSSFRECYSLKSADLSKSVELYCISYDAFENSGIITMCLPKNIETIKSGAFNSSNLKHINLEYCDKLDFIGSEAFKNTFITNIKLTNVDFIGQGAFSYCKLLTHVDLCNCNDLTSISGYLFYNSSLQYIRLPKSIKKIGKYSFANCQNLTYLNLFYCKKLKKIGKSAFKNTELKHLYLPINDFTKSFTPNYIEQICLNNKCEIVYGPRVFELGIYLS